MAQLDNLNSHLFAKAVSSGEIGWTLCRC